MKALCFILLLLLLNPGFTQNSVGIGTDTPNNNAVLELVSPNSNQGFLVPRLSTANRTNTGFTSLLSADDNGLLVFDSDEQEFYYWNTNQWSRLRVTSSTTTDFGGQVLSNAADPISDSDVATKGYVDNININDADADPANEIQDLELNGSELSLTNNANATAIDLSSLDSDAQTLALTGTSLDISGGNSVDLAPIQDGFAPNTDNQTLSRTATAISISGGNSIPEYWAFEPGNAIEGRPDRIDADVEIKAPNIRTEGGVRLTTDRVWVRTQIRQTAYTWGEGIYYGANGSQNTVIRGTTANRSHGEVAIYDAVNGLQARIYVNSSGQGVVTADSKSFHMQHPSKPDYQIWYASLEGPEAAAYSRGQIKLTNGEAEVTYEDYFSEIILQEGITITLTPHSADSKGLAAIERTVEGFKIKELFDGNGSYLVDWEAKSVRKGFEDFKVLRHKDDPDYLK